jgi:hypothetical protein
VDFHMNISDDKTTWGPGPWQHEPDEADWVDRATGLKCRISRGPCGALCGYVAVPKDHPLFGHSYNPPDDYLDLSEDQKWWKIHVNRDKRYCLEGISVHGGLTYGGSWHDEPDSHYFGFDCAHAWDITPKLTYAGKSAANGGVYQDWNYVKEQVESLAKQLKAIK